jgi:hypothetical protein
MGNPSFSYPDLVQQVTGKTIDAAWAEYQAEIQMMDQEPGQEPLPPRSYEY